MTTSFYILFFLLTFILFFFAVGNLFSKSMIIIF